MPEEAEQTEQIARLMSLLHAKAFGNEKIKWEHLGSEERGKWRSIARSVSEQLKLTVPSRS